MPESKGGRCAAPRILMPENSAGRTRFGFSLYPHPARLRPPLAGCTAATGVKCRGCLRGGPEAATVDHSSVLVEGAVMAPDVAEADSIAISTLACTRGTSAMRYCPGFFM